MVSRVSHSKGGAQRIAREGEAPRKMDLLELGH